MRSSRLRHRVEVLTRADTVDAYGQPSATWTVAKRRWAEIVPLGGREVEFAQQIKAEASHRVTLRFDETITTTHRLRFDGRTFDINSVLDMEGRRKALTLLCSEAVT